MDENPFVKVAGTLPVAQLVRGSRSHTPSTVLLFFLTEMARQKRSIVKVDRDYTLVKERTGITDTRTIEEAIDHLGEVGLLGLLKIDKDGVRYYVVSNDVAMYGPGRPSGNANFAANFADSVVVDSDSEKEKEQQQTTGNSQLCSELTARGVSEEKARELCERFPARIADALAGLDYLEACGAEDVRNPGGWLVRAIEGGWRVMRKVKKASPRDGWRYVRGELKDEIEF